MMLQHTLSFTVDFVHAGFPSSRVYDEMLDAVPCGYDKESPDPKRPRFHRGPLQMLDDIGPATVRDVLSAMHACTGDPAFAPAPLLAEHAASGTPFRS